MPEGGGQPWCRTPSEPQARMPAHLWASKEEAVASGRQPGGQGVPGGQG